MCLNIKHCAECERIVAEMQAAFVKLISTGPRGDVLYVSRLSAKRTLHVWRSYGNRVALVWRSISGWSTALRPGMCLSLSCGANSGPPEKYEVCRRWRYGPNRKIGWGVGSGPTAGWSVEFQKFQI